MILAELAKFNRTLDNDIQTQNIEAARLKREEDERAALIEEMLSLSSAMVEALRFGYDKNSATLICNMLLPYTDADAISLTDKEKVLSYVGYLQEDYSPDNYIRTKVTHEVLKDGASRTVLNEEEIGFPEARHKINAAILEPLVVGHNTIGVMKFYFKSPEQVNKSQRMIAKGFSRLISTQIAAQETEHQRELNTIMELKMLQSQINPHFLFNTINTITSLTRTNPDKAREMLRNFAGFYRATLEQDAEAISLGDEIENVRRYVSLQQMRFGEERLTFKVSVDATLYDSFYLPPFIFQPVVENSILHAMPPIGTLSISISAETRDKNLLIKITDDGLGMEQEKADKLFVKGNKDEMSEGLGMAMGNINSRVRGYFGRRAAINVVSEVGKGTTTTFVFPYSLTD